MSLFIISESVSVSPEDQVFISFQQKKLKLIFVKHYIDLRTAMKSKLTELLLTHLNNSVFQLRVHILVLREGERNLAFYCQNKRIVL